MKTLLVGLQPPSNVERILNTAKRRLFESFASVSAIAFGPVVPVGYLSEPVEPPAARELPHRVELAAGRWMHVDGALMLSVEPADRIAQLARSIGAEAARHGDAEGPLPLFAGLYIASVTEAAARSSWPATESRQPYDLNDMLQRLGPPPHLRWSASDLVGWSIELRFPRRWWDDVRCEELWRVRLRKGSAEAP